MIGALSAVYGIYHASAQHIQATVPPDAVAATINGHAIPAQELELYAAQDRWQTFDYFSSRFHIQDSSKFWSTSRGGTTATGYLETTALRSVAEVVVETSLDRQHGLWPYANFDQLAIAWRHADQDRQLAHAQGQIIYGPVRYSELNYLNYLLASQERQLEADLVRAGQIRPTTANLYAYYRTHLVQLTDTQSSKGTSTLGPIPNEATPTFSEARAEIRVLYEDQSMNALVQRLAREAHIVRCPSVIQRMFLHE